MRGIGSLEVEKQWEVRRGGEGRKLEKCTQNLKFVVEFRSLSEEDGVWERYGVTISSGDSQTLCIPLL